MNNRISEKDVVFPALLLLAQAKVHLKNPNIPSAFLKKSIFDNIEDNLSDADLEPLKNRNDTKVDQVIRNLVSNKTLVKSGFASYNQENRTLAITDAGLTYVAMKLVGIMSPSAEIIDLQKQEIIKIEDANKQEKPSRPRMR